MAKTSSPQAYVAAFVTPKAGKDVVDGVQITPDGASEVKLRVRAIPDEGRANKAACALIAAALGVPKSAVSVVSGATSRHKRFLVEGLTQAELDSRVCVIK